jgi:hypothetical protein
VSGAATHATDDVGGEVLLFWTVELTMANAAAIFTDLVLVVAKSTVQSGELAKLITLVIILTLGSRRRLRICEL